MILPRVLTSLVMAPLFLWALYLGGVPFSLLMFFLILLAVWEFHQLAEAGGYATQSWWGVAAGMGITLSLVFPGVRPSQPFAAQAPAFAQMTMVLVLVLREMARADKSLSMLRLGMSALQVLLIAWPLGHFILLRDLRGTSGPALFQIGRDSAFFLVILLWVQDTAAWAAGSILGQNRLAPVISPKKSWEGSLVGLLAAVVTAIVLREAWLKPYFSRPEIIVLAVALGALAQISDLTESLLKRCLGAKDSSSLLPGHGGILDRFDSFIFSTPFLYFYLIVTGRGS